MMHPPSWEKTTIANRLRYLIEVRGYTQVELAKKCGITQAAISNLVTDSSRKPSAPTLLKLAEVLQANAQWVITGEGDPLQISGARNQSERAMLEQFRTLDEDGKALLLALAKKLQNQ